MNRKRWLELGSAALLLVVLGGVGAGWLYQKSLDDALVRVLREAPFDRASADRARSLLRRGASLRAEREDGFNCLMLAAHVGDLELAREALERGMDVNARTIDYEQTALMSSWNEDVTRLLLRAGADVNARDAAGRTALMTAVTFHDRAGIELLLAEGADIRVRNRKGHSVLVYAGRHPGILRLLKERGARE